MGMNLFTKWRNVIRPCFDCLLFYNVYNVLILKSLFFKNLSKQAKRNPSLAMKILFKKKTSRKRREAKNGKIRIKLN